MSRRAASCSGKSEMLLKKKYASMPQNISALTRRTTLMERSHYHEQGTRHQEKHKKGTSQNPEGKKGRKKDQKG